MIKTEKKIFLVAIIAGLFFWLFDALLDYLFFYQQPFADLLILDVPAHAIYIRLLFLIILVIFGAYISKILTRYEKNQERYQQLFDNVNDAIYVHPPVTEGKPAKFIEVNAVACHRSGRTLAEMLQLSPSDLVEPEKAGEMLTWREKLLEDKHILFETVHLAKDGRRIPVEVNAHLVDLNGQPTVLSIARDITARQAAQEALRISEERFRNLVESTSDWVWEVNSHGFYSYSSPQVFDILGYRPEEIIGKMPFDLMPPEEAQIIKAKFTELFISKNPIIRLENTNLHKDGRLVVLETSGMPCFDNDGQIVCYRGIDRDITERKAAQEALAAEKERLSVTLASIGDGVITTDIAGKIVLINHVAQNLTGWTQAEAGGRPLHEVFHIINEKTREVCENPATKVMQTGGIIGLANHTILIAQDGAERVIADSGAPIRDQENNIIGVVLVFRDITEQCRIAEELQKASKLESVGILAGGIAHDYNNLLTGLLGNINLAMLNLNSEDGLREYLTEAEKICFQAKEITTQLLTFAKGGAPVKKVTSIVKLLKETISLGMRGSNARCVFSLPEDLWPVAIDKGQIGQVINNLVINAYQSMPLGGIITVTGENIIIDQDSPLPLKPGRYLKITIADQGIGIPPQYLSKIFDPYFTTKNQGHGLGLATVYSIINHHKGYICVNSEVGVGTTFTFYLPASEDQIQTANIYQEKLFQGQGKILVMDDDASVRGVAAKMLTKLGYSVVLAKDGREALELFQNAQKSNQVFTAAVLDLTIPGGMGGLEVLTNLHRLDPEFKAVVSSGYSNDPIMSDYKTYGFSGVISKPYRIHEISEVLYNVIQGEAQ
jgi:PAS domain S-box-containing protein